MEASKSSHYLQAQHIPLSGNCPFLKQRSPAHKSSWSHIPQVAPVCLASRNADVIIWANNTRLRGSFRPLQFQGQQHAHWISHDLRLATSKRRYYRPTGGEDTRMELSRVLERVGKERWIVEKAETCNIVAFTPFQHLVSRGKTRICICVTIHMHICGSVGCSFGSIYATREAVLAHYFRESLMFRHSQGRKQGRSHNSASSILSDETRATT